MRRLMTVVLGLALLVPAGLAAQRGSHGGRHRDMGRYSRVMGPGDRGVARQGRAAAFSPRFLLGMRETLQLTDEQVSQLEGLAGEMREASEQQQLSEREVASLRRIPRNPDNVQQDLELRCREGAERHALG